MLLMLGNINSRHGGAGIGDQKPVVGIGKVPGAEGVRRQGGGCGGFRLGNNGGLRRLRLKLQGDQRAQRQTQEQGKDQNTGQQAGIHF
jgi:hypothetical protein